MANTTKPEIVALLHRINEGATNSQTSLSEVLRLCMRLGDLLDNKELSNWAKAESGGYESRGNLPKYRIFKTEVLGTFSGPFGSGLDNAPVPAFHIDREHQDNLFSIYMLQPIGELEQIVSGNQDSNIIRVPWPANMIGYYQQKSIYRDLVLTSAWKIITTTLITGSLEVIRARVLEFVLAIERELGIDATNYDNRTPLETPPKEKINQILYTVIYGGNNIALGNTGITNQQSMQVQPGDLQGLKEKLAQLGITEELLSDLDTALDKDADSDEQPGSHVQGWFGKLMIKVGKGTLPLVSAAATTVVIAEVRRFLGLPPV